MKVHPSLGRLHLPRCHLRVRGSRSHFVVAAVHAEEKSLFIFGLGYSGLAAANFFRQKGWKVSGTCRSEDKVDVLRARGFEAHHFDTDGYQQLGRSALTAFNSATHILCTVPPDGDSDPVLMAHSSNLAARAPELTWIGYLSSTSVYGDHKGEWVDEGSELLAAHGKGLSRMLAEGAWLALCYECQVPIHIFRCGGIYGPRRSALGAVQEAMASGRGGTATQERRRLQRYTSRCHVLDICRVLEASAARVRPGAIYNVVDDDPAGRGEVEEFAERLLREAQAQGAMGMWHERSGQGAIDLPSLEVLEDATRASSRAASGRGSGRRSSTARGGVNEVSRAEERWVAAHEAAAVEAASRGEKRVRNDLIKQELEVELEFPTYREGIAALLKGDMRPFD